MEKPYRLLYPLRTFLVTSGVYPEHFDVMTADWVVVLSGEPFMVGVSVSPRRYTHRLLKKHGEFVVAVPTLSMLRGVWLAGTESGPSKVPRLGFKLRRGEVVKAPLVEDAVANLECRVVDSRVYGDHEFFAGEVVKEHYAPEAYPGMEPSLSAGFLLHVAGGRFTTVSSVIHGAD
ncbi:flavin reductase domain protein FMN-binding protein [Desulfurococcus mucosus DSM 2162]|uniref:Flavin reductase domain protein FMN-binding protein n=2 Tax=Desulfurococcus mucosus TaxID=2275 RepID=E8R8N0_DESM0|nr:flavin reductase domain protein FMN-binding protein [Desulfurococcus mucosus DSM 2162]